MKHNGICIAILVLSTVVVVCLADEVVDPKSKAVDTKSGTDQKNTTSLDTSSTGKSGESKAGPIDQHKKNDKKIGASEGVVNTVPDMNNSSKELDSKEVPKVGKDKDGLSGKSHVSEGNKKDGASVGSESKVVPKEVTTKQKSDPVKPPRKEGSRGEECDSSSKCIDENNKLIACLRVPGDDSPELSLLIQYKGTTPLNLEIIAPDSVQLENKTIKFKEKENQKKVKVSIGNDNKNTLIILTAKGSNCSIDFKDLIVANPGEKIIENSGNHSAFADIVTKLPWIALISVLAMMLVASALIYVRFRKKSVTVDGSSLKYEKLETELPMSVGKKEMEDLEDGWDENWGDSWDDEEAPKTPSLPITPSLSSKGLASRKLNKDSWKD